MKKWMIAGITLCLAFSLWACTPKNDVLTKAVFTGIKINPDTEFYAINPEESAVLADTLAFDQWESSTKTAPGKAVAFILSDKDKTTYSFEQDGDQILITVQKEGQTKKSTYKVKLEVTLSAITANSVHVMVHGAMIRAQIQDMTFISANIGSDFTSPWMSFDLTASESSALKDLSVMNISSWTYKQTTTMPQTISAKITGTNQMQLFFSVNPDQVSVIVVDPQNDQEGFDVYAMTVDQYEAMMNDLTPLRTAKLAGPSKEVKEAVFNLGHFELDEIQTWLIEGWGSVLSAADSKTLHEALQVELWVKRPAFTITSITIILESANGLTFTFGSGFNSSNVNSDFGVIVTKKSDPSFKEYYYEGALMLNDGVIYNTLLESWNPPFPESIKTFKYNWISVAYNDPTNPETGIGYHHYAVTSDQITATNALMNYTEWTIEKDPWQFHRGWQPQLIYHNDVTNQTIRVYNENTRTVIWIMGVIPGTTYSSGVYYIAPLSVYQDLADYASKTYK